MNDYRHFYHIFAAWSLAISVAVFVLLLLILFGPLIGQGTTTIAFALYCTSFSWLCAVVWGLCAVKRKDGFP